MKEGVGQIRSNLIYFLWDLEGQKKGNGEKPQINSPLPRGFAVSGQVLWAVNPGWSRSQTVCTVATSARPWANILNRLRGSQLEPRASAAEGSVVQPSNYFLLFLSADFRRFLEGSLTQRRKGAKVTDIERRTSLGQSRSSGLLMPLA
jgi:hypothetical protein